MPADDLAALDACGPRLPCAKEAGASEGRASCRGGALTFMFDCRRSQQRSTT